MTGMADRPAAAAPVEVQHDRGKLTAGERIEVLLDGGAFRPDTAEDAEGVVTGRGEIGGRPVCVISQDITATGGGTGAAEARRICAALEAAGEAGVPVVSLYDSDGVRLSEGLSGLAGQAGILAAHAALAGRVPQIAVVMGPCLGGDAFAPGLADFTVMVRRTGALYVTGPEVVEAVTHEIVTPQTLGGADLHAGRSGLIDVTVDTDMDAMAQVRRLVDHLPVTRNHAPPRRHPRDHADREAPALDTLIPDDPDAPYDMRELLGVLADDGEVLETGPACAGNLITALARIDGRPVGMVANQPAQSDGCLDTEALTKAARFVRTCGAFGVPVLTVVDTPGFVPGPDQEVVGIAGRGADLLRAYAGMRGPRITLVTRKAYGGAYALMAPKAAGAGVVLAWPTARIGLLGAMGAVTLLHPEECGDHEAVSARAETYAESHLAPERAVAEGLVDEIVPPRASRARICAALGGTA